MNFVTRIRSSPHAVLIVVALAIFIDLVAYGVVIPLIPQYAITYSLTEGATGLLVSMFALACLPTQPMIGLVADKIGRRSSMTIGLFFMGAATLLYAIAKKYWVLLVARALQGIASGFTWTIGLASISDVYPPSSLGMPMSVVHGAVSVGTLLGAPAGGLLYDLGGYPLPFIVVGVFCFLDGLARLFLFVETKRDTPESLTEVTVVAQDKSETTNETSSIVKKETMTSESSQKEAKHSNDQFKDIEPSLKTQESSETEIASTSNEPKQTQITTQSQSQEAKELLMRALGTLKNWSLLCILVVQVLTATSLVALEVVLPLHFAGKFNFSSSIIGGLFGVLALASVGTGWLSGYLSDRFRVSKIALICFGLFCFAVLAPFLSLPRPGNALAENRAILLVYLSFFMFLVGAAIGFSAPQILSLFGEVVERIGVRQFSGFLFGIISTAYTVGMVFGPNFGAWLLVAFHENLMAVTLALSFANVIVGAVFGWLFPWLLSRDELKNYDLIK